MQYYKHTSAQCKYSLRANSGEGTQESASIVWTKKKENNECAEEYGDVMKCFFYNYECKNWVPCVINHSLPETFDIINA